MKKRIVLLLIVLFSGMFSLSAQSPTEKWPYVYDTFVYGIVRSTDGSLLEDVQLNICLGDGALHYVNDGIIMAAKMPTVFSVKIGNDVWYRTGTWMMKVLAEGEETAVLEKYYVDTEKLNSTDIGYGISSKTASSTKMTNLGTSSGVLNMSLYDALTGKADGEALPIAQTKYIKAGKRIVQAGKRYVLALDGVDSKAANAFFKENKIKWNDNDSLLKVAAYLKQLDR